MDSITNLIKNEIKRQYKSVRRFSEISGIPYSTLSNSLSKGIGGTAYDTIVKICNLLNLKQVYNDDLLLFNDQFHEISLMLSKLDEQGVHTVKTVLTMEYNRCLGKNSTSTVKAFNGIAFAQKKINTPSNSSMEGKNEK